MLPRKDLASDPAPGPGGVADTRAVGADANRHNSLGFRLLRWASILIPILIFAAVSAWSWRSVLSEADARLSRTVDMLHEHALRSFDTQETTLEAVDQFVRDLNWDEIGASRQVHDFLAALSRHAAPSGGMLLVRPDGIIANGSAFFPASTLSVASRDYFQVHRDGRKGSYFGSVIRAQPQNNAVFTVSRRRSTGSDAFNGIIVAAFKPNYFEDFYASVAESPRDVVALVREDGLFLARSPRLAAEGLGEPRLKAPILSRAQGAEGRAVGQSASPIDGRMRLYHLRRLENYPAYVAYGLDLGGVRSTWLQEVTRYGLACGIAALLLFLLTWQTEAAVREQRIALAEARMEAERRADAEARLRHSQRIEALGQIVGGVAHDFRNILAAVMAGSRAILRKAEDPAEVRRFAELMEKSADRGARLTNRMLNFVRQDGGGGGQCRIEETAGAVAELLGHTLGSGYRLTIDIPSGLPAVSGDPAELETVLVNLVLNGRDAMPDGGTVAVSAQHGQEEGFVAVTVRDTGTGMDADTLARAGEAFFTTKQAGKGTGLGLAMARSFAEQNGGRMEIESAPGEGTAITLVLARVDRPGRAEPAES